MTFEQFQATKTWSANLLADCEAYRNMSDDDVTKSDVAPQSGNIYLGAVYIEHVEPWWPEDAKAQGEWHLILDRREWITNDLTELELRLFEWAASAGYFESEDSTAAMCDEYLVWNEANGLHLGSADAHLFDDDLTEQQRRWLSAFSQRWEHAQRREDKAPGGR